MARKKTVKKVANKKAKKNKEGLISVLVKTHKDKKGGHPHIIMDDIEDKHVSVGLSTKPTKGKGSKNYKLEKNPLKNDKQQSYMRRQATIDNQSNYHSSRQGSMSEKDYSQAKVYAGRAKEKYLINEHKKSNDSANAKKHKP